MVPFGTTACAQRPEPPCLAHTLKGASQVIQVGAVVDEAGKKVARVGLARWCNVVQHERSIHTRGVGWDNLVGRHRNCQVGVD